MSDNPEQVRRSIHPGSGRRGGRDLPKGRQVDPKALEEVRELLGQGARRRDLLIEYLHLLQDYYRCLHARHLAALAQEMKLALVEVYEVASFYAHFDIVLDGETPPPPLTVRVCDSLTCEMFGAQTLLKELPGKLGAQTRVVRAPCMGGCHNAPVVAIGHALHEHASLDSVVKLIKERAGGPSKPKVAAVQARGAELYRLRGLSIRRRLQAFGILSCGRDARSNRY